MKQRKLIDKKKPVGVRLTPECYDKLVAQAWDEHRTVSALVAIIVEEAVMPRKEKVS